MIKTAVIIAGGAGTRLKPLTNDIPKALVPVGGKPILQWIIEWLKSEGIENVVIGRAHKKEKIDEFLTDYDNFGLNIKVSEHTVNGGTAQGFRHALEFVEDDDFLAMNGDELTNLSIEKLFETHKKHQSIATMALTPFHCRFSVATLGDDGRINGFEYGPKLPHVPISIGIYLFNKSIKNYIPPQGSIEDMVFTWLAKQKGLGGHMLFGREEWTSINTHKDLSEAEEKLREWKVL